MKYSLDYSSRFRILKGGKISLVVSALIAGTTLLHAAPSGGVVTSGTASIAQSGAITNITQATQKASINWTDFSLNKNETVNFNQPNINAITLNRVVGNERSIIDGALNANGQVWLLNSNGVLFSKNASINTAGLLATTAKISDADFQAGNYSFTDATSNAIINQGTIEISSGGPVIFASNESKNEGAIKAIRGKVHLVGASAYTINLNGNSLIDLKVDKGALDTLVKNSGTILADGGEVYLTTNAVDELLKGVVNNTGIIEASSLDEAMGKVELFAHGGTASIDGTIEAKDGFVETSGKSLHVSDLAIIKTKKWLLDPDNMIIEAAGGSDFSGESVSATAIQNALSSADIKLQATQDITVNENITWTEATQLKLIAGDKIHVNATIENTNTTNGGVYFNAANVHDKVIFDANVKVIIHNINQLQWMNTALNGNYELGSNIDASVTSGWNVGKGWNPIGNSANAFKGVFDGKNYTINQIFIDDDASFINRKGLFGYTIGATISNIGVTNANITVSNGNTVGILIGEAGGGTITNSYTSGTVTSKQNVGGLVGNNTSTISNSYSLAQVVASADTAGGLVGLNDGLIENSYATGKVTGVAAGGLVAYAFTSSIITSSYATGEVVGSSNAGGLVAINDGGTTNDNSFWDTQTTKQATSAGGGVGKTTAEMTNASTFTSWNNTIWGTEGSQAKGYADNNGLPFLIGVTKFDNTLFNSGYGTEANPYTITNWTQLQNINYASDTTLLSKYYTLSNNIDSTTAGYTDLASATANTNKGWIPIGNDTNNFKGNFYGNNKTISGLTINRPTESYMGLFGVTNGSTIKNIGLVDADIIAQHHVGVLVGGHDSTSIIQNSYATGKIVSPGVNGFYIGGLVGLNNNSSKIENSYANVTLINDWQGSIGGLVGQNYNSSSVINSYALGKVTSSGTNKGGLVGANTATITNSYYDKTINPSMKDETAYGKTTTQMQDIATFIGWSITSDNSDTLKYPYFENGAWKIGKASTPTPTPTPTPDLAPNVTEIVNGVATKAPVLPNFTPAMPQTLRVGTRQGNLVGAPMADMPTQMVSMQEVRQMQQESSEGVNLGEIRVPLMQGSPIEIVNGGVRLPSGIEQEFLMAQQERRR